MKLCSFSLHLNGYEGSKTGYITMSQTALLSKYTPGVFGLREAADHLKRHRAT